MSVQSAIGALIAIYAREGLGGKGQHVDVSMQEAMTQTMDNAQPTWDIRGINISGPGVRRNIGGVVGLRLRIRDRRWLGSLQWELVGWLAPRLK